MLRKDKRLIGLCYDCHDPVVAGKTRCEKHLKGNSKSAIKFINTHPDIRRKKDKRQKRKQRRRITLNGRFKYVMNAVIRSNKVWELTPEQYYEIIARPCHYCEFPNNTEAGRGLDRLDNTRDYILDNVVSCCVECNIARNNKFTIEETKLLGQAIKQIKIDRLRHA